MVPLDAIMARANRLGEVTEAGDDDLDMDAVYWSTECEKARREADGLRAELESTLDRVGVLERRVAELEAELDSLEIIDDDVVLDQVNVAGHGYRGAARPQDPHRELVFDDEVRALGSGDEPQFEPESGAELDLSQEPDLAFEV